MNAFDRWWWEWAARNERLYEESQQARERAVARRWAQAHIDFWFPNLKTKQNDHEQNHD